MPIAKLSSLRIASVQAFMATLNFGSASAAAKEIGCSQSAISRSIKGLNDFLGGEVFEGTNNLRLTPLGEAFVPKAEELIRWGSDCIKLKGRLDAQSASKAVKTGSKNKKSRLVAFLRLP